MRDTYLKGLLITLAGTLVLCPDALLIKMTGSMGPMESAFLRSVFMAVSWGIMVRVKTGGLWPSLRSLSPIGLLAALLQGIDRLAFVTAVQTTTVANTLTIFAAVPAFAAIFAYLALGERCGAVKSIAIAASLAGVIIICGSEFSATALFGNAMAVISAVLYAVYIVCLRFSTRDEVLESLFLSAVFSAVMALPFTDLTAINAEGLGIVAFQGLILLPIGFGLFFTGTRYLPAAEVALIGLLETVLGPLLAWAVIAEVPSQHALLGGAIVVLAVFGQALHGLLQRRAQVASPQPAE
jgi:drug/metabolite transporter (DMT)-like permease